jgi:cytochrome P450
MQSAVEIPLAHLPVETLEFEENPMPFIETARLQHPWLAKSNFGYVVHGYQAMKDLNGRDDKLRPSFRGVVDYYGVRGTPWGDFMEEQIIALSGPEHQRIRGSVAEAFTPRNVNHHRELMRQVISKLLDQWAPRRKFDFAVFASYFPVTVLCGLLGVSPDAVPMIRDALETQGLVLSLRQDLVPDLLAGYDVMWNYVDALVIDRETRGENSEGSVLGTLIAAKKAGRINDRELRHLLMILFPAGYDTSKNMLILIMHTMLTHQDQWRRCGEDLAFCSKVVDEMFRHTSTATVFRSVAEDFVYDDVLIPKGTQLIFTNSLGGRDPRAFSEPMEFKPEREETNRHVAFGRGAHICLGQHLARAQIAEGVHLIAQRIINPRLAGKVKWRPFLGTWGISELPIEFDAVAARPRATVGASA